jgi:3-oxoacyl-(acyl-carrier-protein) synthase
MIAVTGFGIVCAIGNNADEVLCSLQQGRSGVGPMRYLESKHSHLPVGEVKLSNDEMKELLGISDSAPVSRTAMMGAIAIRQAVQDAGVALEGKRVALVSGTTVGCMDVTEQYYQEMKTNDALLSLPMNNDCGKSTHDMASMAGLNEVETCTVSTACSSALNAVILGAEMLKNDEADIVIAGGSEALTRFHLNGFNTLMILDQEPCRPFDDTRAGLNLGEGAAFLVLQKESTHAKAYISGYANRCDAFHQTASSEQGDGAFLAMRDALAMAQLAPADIQYVNAHGTGTPDNDISESRALFRIFGNQMPEVSSTKPFTGHTTSASGSIEAVISILAIQHDFTPCNLGWKNQMPEGITPTLGRSGIQLSHVLCNSFGFGGNDSALILSKRQSGSPTPQSVSVGSSSITLSRCEIHSTEELAALKEFVSPMESRRMGKLMKAAILCSCRALKAANIETPDAIITATSRGMLECSQQFLDDIIDNDEEFLKPTLFMQSTHNTLSSAIAIRTKCHGYNITYAHGDDSLAWAMRDAERLIRNGCAKTILVGCFDESTPLSNEFCQRAGKPAEPEVSAMAIVLTAPNT